jgi:flagellar biogenesis protein FliO
MFFEFLNLIIILVVMILVVWWAKNKVKRNGAIVGRKSRHIKIIDEGLSISIGQRISIIKVGEEYFLMTHGQNGVSMIKIEGGNFEEKEAEWEEAFQKNTKILNVLKKRDDKVE